jgi:hypothetical protein
MVISYLFKGDAVVEIANLFGGDDIFSIASDCQLPNSRTSWEAERVSEKRGFNPPNPLKKRMRVLFGFPDSVAHQAGE